MNLLVVDDSDSIRSLLELVLHPAHELTFAENGAQALEVLRSGTLPDLIVSDLNMPVMDGWELRRRIEADPRMSRVPFVVFSSAEHPPSALAVFSKEEVRRLARFVREVGDPFAVRERGGVSSPPRARRGSRSAR
jgi:CheY-like chemotaxis protein